MNLAAPDKGIMDEKRSLFMDSCGRTNNMTIKKLKKGF
jgi:hypothetical protein